MDFALKGLFRNHFMLPLITEENELDHFQIELIWIALDIFSKINHTLNVPLSIGYKEMQNISTVQRTTL